MRVFAYLGAGHALSPWGGPPAPAPAPFTYALAANGLFVHVALGPFAAALPLCRWPVGAVRGLQPLVSDVPGAVRAGITALLEAEPSAGPLAPASSLDPLACVVVRDPHDPIWAAYDAYVETAQTLHTTYGLRTPSAPPAFATYILGRDGVYSWAAADWGEVIAPVALFGQPALPWTDPVAPRVHLAAPRIPAALLIEVLVRARAIAQESGHEHLWFLCWTPGTPWRIVEPPQRTEPGHIAYDDRDRPRDAVVTIHSHGALGAFFSPTDDRDDRGDARPAHLNIVIGDLAGAGPPSLLCRAGACGALITIPAATLIDGSIPAVDAESRPIPEREAPRACAAGVEIEERGEHLEGMYDERG